MGGRFDKGVFVAPVEGLYHICASTRVREHSRGDYTVNLNSDVFGESQQGHDTVLAAFGSDCPAMCLWLGKRVISLISFSPHLLTCRDKADRDRFLLTKVNINNTIIASKTWHLQNKKYCLGDHSWIIYFHRSTYKICFNQYLVKSDRISVHLRSGGNKDCNENTSWRYTKFDVFLIRAVTRLPLMGSFKKTF